MRGVIVGVIKHQESIALIYFNLGSFLGSVYIIISRMWPSASAILQYCTGTNGDDKSSGSCSEVVI